MSATTTETYRWLIDTTFELQTPLHLGTGQSEAEPSGNADNEETWVAGILLDHEGKATIPGASLKGALRALAEREGLLSAELKAILGAVDDNSTTAGKAEFRYATAIDKAEFRYATAIDKVEETRRPHVAIDRVTGTAMDKKLFQTRLIPAGTRFKQRIVLHKATQAQVEALVALLQGAGQDATFTLGAHASQGLGALRLCGQPDINRFGPVEAKNWLEQDSIASWEEQAVSIDNLPASEAWPTTEQGPRPTLPLQLAFSSPFLVKGDVKTCEGHDVTVPMLRDEKVILPASSLRGRLRSQAERILRTLGLNVPQGHDARPWRKGEAHTDLAAFLFGSAGWRALIGASDCIDTAAKSRLQTQELLAIDRFTGGGKDGAKFTIEAAECPTLAGQLHLDVHRLKQAGDACWPALGLFTLVLRDLAEGDIAFGHGIAKGYGQCQEKQVLAAWESLLEAQFPEQADPVAQALAELRKHIKQDAVVCEEPFTDVKNVEFGPLNIPPINNDFTNSFLNPYHFIPFGKPDTDQWTTPEKLQSERGHDRYQGLSGRISCQLTTKTPLFIGSSREEGKADEPASLKGYEFQNKRAIPATSLRGMISSLFESISGSGLRVLHPQPYSMRKTNNHLSAMGRIVLSDDKQSYMLTPWTLPTLDKEKAINFRIPSKWKKIPDFADRNARLKVYFDDDWGRYEANEGYFMRLPQVQIRNGIIEASDLLRYPNGNKAQRFLIGLRNDNNQRPITQKTYDGLSASEQHYYVPGLVRSLPTGKRQPGSNSASLLPSGVKHYVFVPKWDGYKLNATKAINRFKVLADLALKSMNLKEGDVVDDDTLLPYVPAGRQPGSDRKDSTKDQPYGTRLRSGDIVFFDIDDNGEVSEISFSSMWRTGIYMADDKQFATTADLLAQYDPNLLPLGMGDRQPLFSPADLLFGAVEYRAPGNKKANSQNENKKQALALAGRVSIGIAQADAARVTTEPAITLKELSSPKPPSPALYFKPIKGDGYVSKANLADSSSQYTLRGRKTYLHAWREQGQVVKLNDKGLRNDQQGREPWASKHHGKPDSGHKRRVKVEPIAAGQSFSFHIDFHNLSERELQQLCATLQPDPAFEHRLGMGKPLGLGSVKLQIRDIQLINRTNRYASDALTADRSHQTLSTEEIISLAAAGMQAASSDVRRALQLLGNPAAIAVPVHYPQMEGGELEEEHFKWFMTNDDLSNNASTDNKQSLKAISANTSQLPSLKRLKPKDKNPSNYQPNKNWNRNGR